MKNQEQSNKISFKGQNVFIGIDVHLKQWHVCVCSEYISKPVFTMAPDAKGLKAYLEREFPEADYYSAYESGFCGFHVHRELEAEGIHNIVFNAADIKDSQKERMRKSDAVDCIKICRNLQKGELTPIYVPDEDTQAFRELLSFRSARVKSRTRVKNRIKGLLNKYGIEYPEQFSKSSSHWTKAFREWIVCVADSMMPLDTAYIMREYIEELERLDLKIRKVNRKINEELKTKYAEMDSRLRSVPGIGRLCSALICAYICDINRFDSDDKLAGYIGLVPDVRGSGEKNAVLGITRRGNKLLRPALVECAWQAIRKDPALAAAYSNFCKRGLKPNNAIIRIARKMVNRIRYVMRCGNDYKLSVVKKE